MVTFVCRFPIKNKVLLAKWVAAVRRDKWQPGVNDVLCSEHFDGSCFRSYNLQVRLKEDAVPSIFQFPEQLRKSTVPRQVPERHERPNTSSNIIDTPTKIPSSPSTSSVPLEHSYSINKSPCGIKRKYDQILAARERQCSSVSYRLKGVRRKLIRRQKKLKDMGDIVKHLKLRKDVSEDAVRLLEQCFGSIPAEMLRRKLAGRKNAPYSDAIR